MSKLLPAFLVKNNFPYLAREKIIELYWEKHLSTRETAKLLDTNQKTLIRHMKICGISRRTLSEAHKHRTKYRRKLAISKERLKDLYHTKKLSARIIGEMFHVGTTSVYYWMKKYKIPRRIGAPPKGNIPWNKGKRFPQVAGSKNYRWKGGYKPYYGANWRYQRKKAWERDGYKCQTCGKERDKNGRVPDVHHIIPFSEFGIKRYREANSLDNLITLCMSCHCTTEHRREKLGRNNLNDL